MAAWPPHMEGSIVFARWQKSALHLIHDSLGPFESIKKGIANGISISSAVFALYNGLPLSAQNCPFKLDPI